LRNRLTSGVVRATMSSVSRMDWITKTEPAMTTTEVNVLTLHGELATGPFRFVRFEIKKHVAGGVVKAGGTCERCSQAIANAVILTGSNGVNVTVGVDCARICTESAANRTARLAIESAERAHLRALAKAATTRREADMDAWLSDPSNTAKLATIPSPVAWRASNGDTMLDWLRWAFDNGGATYFRKCFVAAVKATVA